MRICMVEVKGARSLVTACVYPVNEGMEIFTNTERVRKSRKMTLELILSTHDRKCLSCVRREPASSSSSARSSALTTRVASTAQIPFTNTTIPLFI